RDFPQLHSQSVLSFAAPQSFVQHPGIDHGRLQPNLLRIHSHAASQGNADRPDEHGETIDWISIYKHGHEGEAENPFKYTFFSFFREDPKTVFNELKRKNPREAFWGVTELAMFVSTFVILGILNGHYIVFL